MLSPARGPIAVSAKPAADLDGAHQIIEALQARLTARTPMAMSGKPAVVIDRETAADDAAWKRRQDGAGDE